MTGASATSEDQPALTRQTSAELSEWEIAHFRYCGYLRSDEPLPSAFVDELRTVLDDQYRREVPPLRRNQMGTVCRLNDVVDRHPSLRELIEHPAILRVVHGLLGRDVEFVRGRHNHATRNLAGDHEVVTRLHRDVAEWSRNILSVIVYLEDSTLENGCTRVLPGSHMLPPPTGYGVTGDPRKLLDSHAEMGRLDPQAVDVVASAGQFIAFDSLLFHAVGRNTTPGSRDSVALGYRSVDEVGPSSIRLRGHSRAE